MSLNGNSMTQHNLCASEHLESGTMKKQTGLIVLGVYCLLVSSSVFGLDRIPLYIQAKTYEGEEHHGRQTCCQASCKNPVAVQDLITAADIQQPEIHSVCCLCLVSGKKPSDVTTTYLWYVNGCGVLEELGHVVDGLISVVGQRTCNVCFVKATFTDNNNMSSVRLWRMEIDGSLTVLKWAGVSSIVDFETIAIRECGLCFIKATVKEDVYGPCFEVLWRVEADGSLTELVGKCVNAASIDVIAIRACNLCFVKVDIRHAHRVKEDHRPLSLLAQWNEGSHEERSVLLWRVECNGILTKLVGPGTGVTACRLDLTAKKDCKTCFIRAELQGCEECSAIVWRLEDDGSLLEKRFFNEQP